MTKDLIVKQGTTVILDENPTGDLAGSLQLLKIESLSDLVKHGFVRSKEKLSDLLNSAKKVTDDVVRDSRTFTPFIPVPGTSRPDLRRFGRFIAATPNVNNFERDIFWRIFRDFDPNVLEDINTDTKISGVPSLAGRSRVWIAPSFLLTDIVVESNASLVVRNMTSIRCRDLMIRRNGRIVVEGSGLYINAHSI